MSEQTGTIQEVGHSQKGNPKVKINGTWYSTKFDGFKVGQTITFEDEPFTMQGRTYHSIKAWENSRSVGPASAPPATSPQQASAPTHDRALQTSPFVSNVIGQAIAAKLISRPEDILPWYEAALAAVRGDKEDSLNDKDIGF